MLEGGPIFREVELSADGVADGPAIRIIPYLDSLTRAKALTLGGSDGIGEGCTAAQFGAFSATRLANQEHSKHSVYVDPWEGKALTVRAFPSGRLRGGGYALLYAVLIVGGVVNL